MGAEVTRKSVAGGACRHTLCAMAKQRQVRIEQKSALAAMSQLEERSDEELLSETRYRAAAQAILGARAAERYDAQRAREHFRKAIAAARPQERMQLRRMAEASLALAERRPDDLKAAVEKLGQTAPSSRQLFVLRLMGLISPAQGASKLMRVRGVLIILAMVVALLVDRLRRRQAAAAARRRQLDARRDRLRRGHRDRRALRPGLRRQTQAEPGARESAGRARRLMCGRYTLASPDLGALRERFPLRESLEVRPRFNVAPGDDVLAVIRRGEDGAEAEGTFLRWGLVPFWAADPGEVAAKTINARAETVAERPGLPRRVRAPPLPDRRRRLLRVVRRRAALDHAPGRRAVRVRRACGRRGGRRARRARSSRCAPARSSRPPPPAPSARCTTACRSSSIRPTRPPGSTRPRRPSELHALMREPRSRRRSSTGRSAARSTTPATTSPTASTRRSRPRSLVLTGSCALRALDAPTARPAATSHSASELITTGSIGISVAGSVASRAIRRTTFLPPITRPSTAYSAGSGASAAVTMKNWLPDVPGARPRPWPSRRRSGGSACRPAAARRRCSRARRCRCPAGRRPG